MTDELNLTEQVKNIINAALIGGDTNPLNTSIMIELEQNTGKPLLVELQDGYARKASDCWNPGGTSSGRLQLYLGIIDPATPFKISPKNQRIHLPTTTYVKYDGSPYHPNMTEVLETEEGNIVLGWSEIPDTHTNWNLKSKLSSRDEAGTVREMQLLEGEKVEQYFSEKFDGEWIPFYLHSCVLLGYDPSPQTKGKIVENIRRMEENAKPSLDHNEQIQKKIAEARELKLDQGIWSYESQPGVTINGPVYLNELCRKYKVE